VNKKLQVSLSTSSRFSIFFNRKNNYAGYSYSHSFYKIHYSNPYEDSIHVKLNEKRSMQHTTESRSKNLKSVSSGAQLCKNEC